MKKCGDEREIASERKKEKELRNKQNRKKEREIKRATDIDIKRKQKIKEIDEKLEISKRKLSLFQYRVQLFARDTDDDI